MESSPPPADPTVSGPVDPSDFHTTGFAPPTAAELDDIAAPGPEPYTVHAYTRPSALAIPRSMSGPAGDQSGRSNPVLLPSRRSGTVKDIANRFDRSAASNDGRKPLIVATNRARYTRAFQRSPIRASSANGRPSPTKLQKRRLAIAKSPRKSPSTSFETEDSFSPAGTALTTRSHPYAAFSRRRSRSPSKQAIPLFGEITADGKWNGNFDLGNYGPLPAFERAPRRGSEGSLALAHGRSRSHQDNSTPSLRSPSKQTLIHRRSRSDMDAAQPQLTPSMPNLSARYVSTLYPTPPDSTHGGTRQRNTPPSSRIPVPSGGRCTEATPPSYSRSASAMSNRIGRRRLSNSPTRLTKSKENAAPHSRSRYLPPSISPSNSSNQMLPARIVAPLPKTSPPLRSSRPRQPVSSATTSASRARAAERYHSQYPGPRDGRRPSEQWLGAPHNAQKERNKRQIPELDKIDFEQRRARIQKAITQSLKSNESYEELRSSRSQSRSVSRSSRFRSRIVSHEQAAAKPEDGKSIEADPSTQVRSADGRPCGLSLETKGLLAVPGTEPEPFTSMTERTMFEDDESPILGRPATEPETKTATTAAAMTVPEVPQEQSTLLNSATYRVPSNSRALALTTSNPGDNNHEPAQNSTILNHVAQLRERSKSPASRDGTEFADDSPTVAHASDETVDQWGLGSEQGTDQGSIRIMLDHDPSITRAAPWFRGGDDLEHVPSGKADDGETQEHNNQAFTSDGCMESPVNEPEQFVQDAADVTPRKPSARDDTLRPGDFPSKFAPSGAESTLQADGRISQVLDYYRSTGSLTADMVEEMQLHIVDLRHLSANGVSDADVVQSLLESIRYGQPTQHITEQKSALQAKMYEMPAVTPDTPDTSADYGHVIVYGSDSTDEEEEDFAAKRRKADEDWERQQRGEDPFVVENEQAPVPPPKDFGYTPRSSIGPNSTVIPLSSDASGLRISTFDQLDMAAIQAAGDRVSASTSPLAIPTPSPPSHEPPAPPPKIPLSLLDSTCDAPHSERGLNDVSPRLEKVWQPSGSSRPSLDSQRVPPTLPGSYSMNSLTDSTRRSSLDTSGDQTRLAKAASPDPEQKRLLRRRHIIKELLDTENSYHQDLKIIEDIYKATCTPDLVQPEDKKVLFGNCDEVERFALHFYDEMRKSVTQIYVPAKQHRWTNKRGSFSTTQSDGATQNPGSETLDDARDRTSTIGKTFLDNMLRMEQVYGSYLKNHDAANQRLSAIQGTTTVKCWLDECHANASDITAAWDLDSLLVKPTQRVAKYPMLLQQLLETTPVGHPDHENIKSAAKDSITMLTRINDAKRRADLVDQVINGRGRKDSDIRSGLAKAFGRRTEKLKERVGIAEAFQDTEFDELAHKFGGNYIRLQICMRDVQDYISRTEKATELVNNYANALELFTDVAPSTLPEIESKWRKYGQVIRDLTQVAFEEHKSAVQKRVLEPMLLCIKLHDGPQNAMNKRKKRILDYAKCKSEERRGLKPDKKTIEASDLYLALNDQLKIELPKLYSLTAQLVLNCLNCFLDAQIQWQSTWERKLRPLLEVLDVPVSIQQIESAFSPDFIEIKKRCATLSICNGSLVQEAANFLSPQTTLVDPSSEASSRKRRPSTLDSSSRTLSVGSESSNAVNSRRHSGIYSPGSDIVPSFLSESRLRSNSSLSARARPSAVQGGPSTITSAHRPWSNASTPNTSFSGNRPSTGNYAPSSAQATHFARPTSDVPRSPRPTSDATYFTARPDLPETHRFSGLFTSALPPDTASNSQPSEPATPRAAATDMKVLFVCASLFEFSIEQTRKEGGYPYLQYVQGEIFDVVGQKGELWLAKNQDDESNMLGWIWEQHFIIVGQDEG